MPHQQGSYVISYLIIRYIYSVSGKVRSMYYAMLRSYVNVLCYSTYCYMTVYSSYITSYSCCIMLYNAIYIACQDKLGSYVNVMRRFMRIFGRYAKQTYAAWTDLAWRGDRIWLHFICDRIWAAFHLWPHLACRQHTAGNTFLGTLILNGIWQFFFWFTIES